MIYRVVTSCFAGLALLTACTNKAKEKQADAREMDSGKVRVFTFIQGVPVPNQPAPTFHMVALTGQLLVESNCLILDSGERKFALVFREKTVSYDALTSTLFLDGRRHPIGSSVTVGGSGGSAVQSLPQGDPKQKCGADDTWIVTPGSFKQTRWRGSRKSVAPTRSYSRAS